jgi:hypothetical protein
MAAVIKELSPHLGHGVGAILSAWSLYVLLAAGAVTMLLASHALAAGPLAASQPGFTILDPLAADLLGVFLFGEHTRTGPADLAGWQGHVQAGLLSREISTIGAPTLSKRWKATSPAALGASRWRAPRGRRTRACAEPPCARTGRAHVRPFRLVSGRAAQGTPRR